MEIVKDLEFLRTPSKVIRPHQISDIEVLLEAVSLCRELEGYGLAAPQIGIHQRWFVMMEGDGANLLFNPEILEEGEEETIHVEGCLSIPGPEFVVRRKTKIRVKYQELDGRFRIKTLTGMKAIIFQHELDHLNGIVVADKGERL